MESRQDGSFGNVHFDPDEEKTLQGKNDYDEKGGIDSPPRSGSVYNRRASNIRGSITEIRASMSKEPGWDRRSSNIMGTKGSFADQEGEEIDYNTMSWWHAGLIMIAETVSLGILSLPSVLATIGMVPGIILILGLGAIATYTGLIIGTFRLKYPWVHSFGDAGEVLGEPIKCGRLFSELFGWAQTLFQIFTMASHVLTFTICMNTLTDHATCTIVWGIVGLVVLWILDLPRTLKNVSYMSIASFASILGAVFITMISVGVAKPIGDGRLKATATLGFTQAFLSVSNITFAYAGHSCFFGFIAEMKRPEDWPKALAVLQSIDITLYLTTAVVVYRYAGDNVTSPALGSAPGVMKKVAWGIALPTILIAAVIYGHIAAKYIFIRIFRGTKHVVKRTFLSTVVWYSLTGILWVIAWIIAESIPNFNDLLALISSLFAVAFTYYIPGWFWLFMNFDQGVKGWFRSWKHILNFMFATMAIFIGVACCILGLWSSGVSIAEATGGHSWSCADNSNALH